MILLSLIDVAPDPGGTGGVSIVIYFLLALIILAITALVLGGLVFLVWRKRRKARLAVSS